MHQIPPNRYLIFELEDVKFYQIDAQEAFLIEFYQDQLSFKLCDLIRFRNKLNKIDIASLFAHDSADTELIYLPSGDSFLLLTIQNILLLKELIQGSLVMMEVNSMIQKNRRLSWV